MNVFDQQTLILYGFVNVVLTSLKDKNECKRNGLDLKKIFLFAVFTIKLIVW